MVKLLIICFILFLPPGWVMAQPRPGNSPGEQIMCIKKSLPDTNRIKLELQLSSYYIDKPNEDKKDLDSAYTFLSQALKLSNVLRSIEWRNKTLALTAACDVQAGNLPHAKACFMQIIDYYHKINHKQQEAESWNALGKLISADNKSDIPYKIECFERARAMFQQTRDKLDEIESLQNIAEAHFNDGKLDQAENELRQVLLQYKAIGYKKLNDTYDLLAEINKSKPDLHKELFYRLELIKNMEATADTARSDHYYAKLALAYSDLAMYPQSLAEILQSIQILKRRSTFEDFYGDLSLAMYDFICEGRPADGLALLERSVKEVPPQNLTQSVDMNEEFANCYKSLKQYHKAEQYYIEMMRIFKVTSFNKNFYNNKSDMLMDFIYYNQTLGDFYLLTKQFKKAGFYINKILLLPEGTVRPISLRKILLMKFRIDSASGNYISAINHFEMYKKLNDSLFNITKNQQITEMLVKYETNKKDQSIKLLKSHSLSEYAKLQKANLERNITFIGIAMVLIIAGLAYNGYRNKQRSNLKLEVKRYEINKQNQALQCLISEKDDLLTEKDLLLREIHHRVKNNLQTTMSLLNMQSSYISNEEALEAIRSSQRRMHTMSLIHQKLYQSSNLTCIDMATYINELVTYLKESFEGTGNINFKLQTQTINLDVAQAIPLGLIINEAITNAIKYAFPENRRGTITISLNQVKHDNFRLIISDDGVGLPESFNISRTNSLGIKLMKGLSDQLQGDFYLRVDHGTCATVEFEYHDILKQGFAASNEVLV